jgi:hypothetical protein
VQTAATLRGPNLRGIRMSYIEQVLDIFPGHVHPVQVLVTQEWEHVETRMLDSLGA